MCGHREAATSPTDHEKQGTADEAAVPLSLSSTTSRGAYHQCGSGRRVKLYVLEHQAWADRGTGYCASVYDQDRGCLLYTSPSPRDRQKSRMPSSA